MLYKERIRLIEAFGRFEKEYPLSDWRAYGIDFWPSLKMELWFLLIHRDNPKKRRPERNALLRTATRAVRLIQATFVYQRLKLKRVDYVLSGAHTHRVVWQNRHVNRFFAPLKEHMQNSGISFLETDYLSLAKTSGDSVRLDRLLPLFTFNKIGFNETNLPRFLEFRKEAAECFRVEESEISSLLSEVSEKIRSWYKLYSFIFKHTRPKYALGLSYYSPAILGMNLAARKMDVVSVDIQHGMQGNMHPAYRFVNLPDDSFNILPQEFWCWDSWSAENIKSWGRDRHEAKILGHPWIDYLQKKVNSEAIELIVEKKRILYTPQTISPLVDNYLLRAIKATTDKYDWWIRLHPRSSSEQRQELSQLLEANGLTGKLNVDSATEEPLPLILKSTYLHISKFSGCLIEAAMSSVPSLILEELGSDMFAGLVEAGYAKSFIDPTTEDIVTEIESVMKWQLPELKKTSFEELI